MAQRVVVWFSYGAASAVAWKLAKEKYENVIAVNCDTSPNEHPDNERFKKEVENWVGDEVIVISSEKYKTIEDVSNDTRYMSGVNGARCTTELKKIPRHNFQLPDDIHIFGFTAEEKDRIERFKNSNFDTYTAHPLLDNKITKKDCFDILEEAGIELPAMYKLGFKNNNCIGCYKATSAKYWNQIRHFFPEVFKKRAEDSKKLGVKLTKLKNKRIFLDELPSDYLYDTPENLSCGPECGDSTKITPPKSTIPMATPNTRRNVDASPEDLYQTNPEAVKLAYRDGVFRGINSVYDPCDGLGNITRTLEGLGIKASSSDVIDYGTGIEVFNYLKEVTGYSVDALVMNPPFTLTFEFLDKAVKEYSKVIMFNRVSFLETVKRAEKLDSGEWPLTDIYFHAARTGCSKGVGPAKYTNAVFYAWYIFDFDKRLEQEEKGMCPQTHWIL